MSDDDDLRPTDVDVYVWGKSFPRVVQTLRQRQGSPHVFTLLEGVEGATLSLPYGTTESTALLVLELLERFHKEGELELGMAPEKALDGETLRERVTHALLFRPPAPRHYDYDHGFAAEMRRVEGMNDSLSHLSGHGHLPGYLRRDWFELLVSFFRRR